MNFLESLEQEDVYSGTVLPVMANQFVQFELIGDGGYRPTGATQTIMPAGVYEIASPDYPYFSRKGIITDHLLQLPDSKSVEIIDEIKKFWTLKDKFTKYGFIHKRGVLMYGPPGTGKTCTLNLIAKHMVDMGGIVILGHKLTQFLPMMLGNLRQVHPNRPIVVFLEDIDELFNQNERVLLSLLDGE